MIPAFARHGTRKQRTRQRRVENETSFMSLPDKDAARDIPENQFTLTCDVPTRTGKKTGRVIDPAGLLSDNRMSRSRQGTVNCHTPAPPALRARWHTSRTC